MDLRVLDTSFEDRLVMDIYESAIWVDRYDLCGDFELQIPISDWRPDYIIPDHYLANKKSEHLMIIEGININSDIEEGTKVIVTGQSLESILKRRIIWSQTTLSGNLQLGIKKLIDENAINPMYPVVNPNLISLSQEFWESGEYALAIEVQPSTSYVFNTNSDYHFRIKTYDAAGTPVRDLGDIGANSTQAMGASEHYVGVAIFDPTTSTIYEQIASIKPYIGLANPPAPIPYPERKIQNLVFEMSTDPLITALTIEAQYTGDNLYDAIVKICRANNIGFKVTLNSSNQFVFKLYAGADRSYAQTTNPYVIFSPDFDNLLNSKYLYSKAPLKNVTLVGGEGEGYDRRFTTVGVASGLNRREIFTDAKDISSNVDGVTLSEADYLAQLQQRGKEKLAENVEVKYFDGSIESDTQFQLGRDFFQGDIVQVADDYGNLTKVRVVEVIMAEDESGESIYPTCRSAEEVEEE
jgi:hypothetical protein